MISINPFSEIGTFIPSFVMQTYVVAMFLLVIGATIFDVIHKKSAKYFFNNSVKAKKSATRNVGSGEKASLAFKTATNEVLTSSEFCSTRRRLAHLLTMYGFVLFVIATAVMIFSYSAPNSMTPSIWPLMWHLGAATATTPAAAAYNIPQQHTAVPHYCNLPLLLQLRLPRKRLMGRPWKGKGA